jgi:hypothetical protein
VSVFVVEFSKKCPLGRVNPMSELRQQFVEMIRSAEAHGWQTIVVPIALVRDAFEDPPSMLEEELRERLREDSTEVGPLDPGDRRLLDRAADMIAALSATAVDGAVRSEAGDAPPGIEAIPSIPPPDPPHESRRSVPVEVRAGPAPAVVLSNSAGPADGGGDTTPPIRPKNPQGRPLARIWSSSSTALPPLWDRVSRAMRETQGEALRALRTVPSLLHSRRPERSEDDLPIIVNFWDDALLEDDVIERGDRREARLGMEDE